MAAIYSAEDRTPFTYLIGWSKLNIWYYGVKYAKGCLPSDLFTKYFTSSKHVKNFLIEHGNPDIIQIRKIFTSVSSARNWETKVITRLNMDKSTKFLNKCSSKGISIEDAIKYSKGKTYEEIYGAEKAKELKLSRSKSNKERKLLPWEERKNNRKHGNSNKERTESENNIKKIKSKEMWDNIEHRIKIMQNNNTHFCIIGECLYCHNLFDNRLSNKKYCSISCANKNRKIV